MRFISNTVRRLALLCTLVQFQLQSPVDCKSKCVSLKLIMLMNLRQTQGTLENSVTRTPAFSNPGLLDHIVELVVLEDNVSILPIFSSTSSSLVVGLLSD